MSEKCDGKCNGSCRRVDVQGPVIFVPISSSQAGSTTLDEHPRDKGSDQPATTK